MNRSASKGATLELNSLSRTFGRDVKALDEFSITVNQGELISLLGPSGCGKTTALRIIAGLEEQDSGAVLVNGLDISNVSADKRNMGMVFQQYSLFPNLNALDNVAFGLEMRGVNRNQRISRANELLELVGLPSHARRLPHQLSGGQQQRVALARAIAFEPQILLLDEPLSALDAQVRVQIREEIRRIQIQYGITTLFVTHDQEEAMAISDRVAVMNYGKLEQIDTPEVLYRSPQSPFVASFVGVANKVSGVMSSDTQVRIFEQNFKVSPRSQHNGSGTKVEALVRPEDVHISQGKTSSGVSATILIKSFLGPYTTLGAKVDDRPILHIHTDSKETQNIKVGDTIQISISAEQLMVTTLT